MKAPARSALLLCAVFSTFVFTGLGRAGSRPLIPPPTRATDPEVYERILSRLHSGEGYYTVVGSELRANHYATVEVFNWRTPLLWYSLARVSPGVRRALLSSLAALGAVLATLVAGRRSTTAGIVTGAMALGVAIMMSAPGSVAMGEAWAGVLMGLSACGFAAGWNRTATACGLFAIFVRELVAPYALICTFVAVRRRNWGEVAIWLLGGVAYATYYGVHLVHVWASRLPTDVPSAGSWVSWGGLAFLLSTVEWNSWLFFAPWVVVRIALAMIVAGVLAERAPVHVSVTSAVYCIMFLAIGQSFDRYWGFLTWPSWVVACGFGVDATITAVRTLATTHTSGVRVT